MTRRAAMFLKVAAALLSLHCAASAQPAPSPASLAIRRGVNVLGYDGVWKGETDAPFRMDDFRLIRAAGFDHVRINFFGLHFMDPKNRLDGEVLARLDRVLDAATAAGLTAVLDQHDNALCQQTPPACKEKIVAFWRQIAKRYAGARPRVVYEILNEPGGHMSAAEWNDALAAALAEIRAADPDRAVIVAALNAGDIHDIEKLDIPPQDRNLIVTVHYYEPMRFTHQGAPWSSELASLRDVAWGAEESRRKVDDDFAVVARWAAAQKRPIYLGEFGVYDSAPPLSRAAWMAHVAQTAQNHGWGWAYWQFDHDFALFDTASHGWKQPFLDALMGAGAGDRR